MSYQQAMYDRDHPRYSEPTEYITMEVDDMYPEFWTHKKLN